MLRLDAWRIYSYSILVTTTIHVPPDLLESVDRRAGELRISRNRFIIRALEKALDEQTGWSPRFLDELASAGDDLKSRTLVDRMRKTIAASRTRKSAPEL